LREFARGGRTCLLLYRDLRPPHPQADDADYYDVDAEHGEEAGASSGAGVALEEFDDVEHGKSFSVNEMSGLTVMLMGTLVKGKGGGRERASAGTQVMIDKGYHTVYMFSDDRDPVRPLPSCPLAAQPTGYVLLFAPRHQPCMAPASRGPPAEHQRRVHAWPRGARPAPQQQQEARQGDDGRGGDSGEW